MEKERREKYMRKIVILILIFLISMIGTYIFIKKDYDNKVVNEDANNQLVEDIKQSESKSKTITITATITENEINDWKLVLVNYENALPDDFNVELSNIDKTRKFDSRAINELTQMLQEMKNDGISDMWVQSSYRSIEYQQSLFDNQVNTYISQGKSKEEAENLTLKTINKPGTSEHNLGLAIDFNYVDYNFENTKGFKWLQKNAEKYGFILRYKKEKEDITKVDYEPWHWRYVGVENAKKMNELDMCLEEYIEFLKSNNT